jgi:hypothetical protein
MAYLFQRETFPQVRCTFTIVYYYFAYNSLVFPATQRMLLCPFGVLVPMKTFSRLPIRKIPVTSDHNSLHQTQSLNKIGSIILGMNGAFLTHTYTIFAVN